MEIIFIVCMLGNSNELKLILSICAYNQVYKFFASFSVSIFLCRKERKKLKKDRSNTFKDKFKSIKVKKREKEHKEKNKEKEREKEKEKEKEKEEKKEKKEKKKHKRSLSSGDSLAQSNVQPSPPGEFVD